MFLSGSPDRCSVDPNTVLAGLAIAQVRLFSFLGACTGGLLVIWMLFGHSYLNYKNHMRNVAPGVRTPEASGQGQYGTASWMEQKDYQDAFYVAVLDRKSPFIRSLAAHGRDDLKEGGGTDGA